MNNKFVKFFILLLFCLLGIIFLSQPNFSRAVELTSPLLTLKGHSVGTNSVKFNPDGTLLVTGAQDGTARIWDAKSGLQLSVLKGHKPSSSSKLMKIMTGFDRPVFFASFSPEGQKVVTTGGDSTVRLWNAANGKQLNSFKVKRGGVKSALFTKNGSSLLILTQLGSLQEVLIAKKSSPSILLPENTDNSVQAFDLSPDQKTFATGSVNGVVAIWELKNL